MSTDDKTGGPAFPLPLGTMNASEWSQSGGMTLRDYFAAKAMQAHVARGDDNDPRVAIWSYAIADSMLTERSKQ